MKRTLTPTKIARRYSGSPAVEHLEGRQLLTGTPLFGTTSLVSDGAVPAAHIDADLINPWGVAFAPGGEFWVSDNNSGKSTLYDGAGNKLSLVINVPGAGGAAGTPTGQVFNAAGFNVTENGTTGSSAFIFASEDGIISAWSPTVDQNNAIVAVDHSATAVYKGLAMGTVAGASQLFAANFRAGTVDVFDSSFNPVQEPKRAFVDHSIPKSYAPFNVQNIGGNLVVTYAKQNSAKHDDVGGAGHGYVDVFNTSGKLLHRLQRGAFLNSPWGVAIAPTSFGKYAGDMLIGNFKGGSIDVFNPKNGRFIGFLKDANRKKIEIPRLWALTIGSGGPTESTDSLYFTAGINNEQDGLFGTIEVVAVTKPVAGGGAGGGGLPY